METDRLQHERARSSEKRQNAEKEAESEEESEEVLTPVIGDKDVETTKMLTLDLIKAVDQSFSSIHSALRPKESILPAEWACVCAMTSRLSCTPVVESAVSTDIVSTKTTGGGAVRW